MTLRDVEGRALLIIDKTYGVLNIANMAPLAADYILKARSNDEKKITYNA